MSERGYYRIHIRKEALKFSSAHMTVFADGTKERLHGHNYRTDVSLDFTDFSLDRMIAFSEIKQVMKSLCDQWDEKVFLPERCPHFKVAARDSVSIDFTLCGKRYVLPIDEVQLLPVNNVTTESLAERFCSALVERIGPLLERGGVRRLELRIEEITGQGASYVREWSRP